MYNYKVFPLFLLLAVLLPGCFFKKDGVEVKGKSKKIALTDSGKGIPLGGSSDEGKSFDDEVERYVLDETSDFDHNDEMKLARADLDQKELVQDSAYDAQHFVPVYFKFDQHSIDEEQQATVAFDIEQAKELLKESDGVLAIEGHSDGHFISETYNIAKSERRAHAIAKELEAAGIEKSRIKVIGYGDKRKAVNVSGKEAKNRRVELVKLTEVA